VQRAIAWLGALVWLVAVLAGFRVLVRYANTPGRPAEAPAQLSPGTLRLEGSLPTLLVFVHPMCPCTRATLTELQRLAARCAGRLRTRILFRSDDSQAVDWSSNDLWQQAEQVPGAEVELDPEGREARSLGVHTSGQALLYAKDGRLQFAGGITASRGHEGENTGEDEIVDLVEGRRPQATNTPVFGCPLSGADCDVDRNRR
jgi:hypothetical protein